MTKREEYLKRICELHLRKTGESLSKQEAELLLASLATLVGAITGVLPTE